MLVQQITVTATPTLTQSIGAITAIASDGSSFTIQTATGQLITLLTGGNTAVVNGLAVGDEVQVSGLTLVNGTSIAESVTELWSETPGAVYGSGGGVGTSQGGGSGGDGY